MIWTEEKMEPNNTLSESDIENLKAAAKKGPEAWNDATNIIKKKLGGYPIDWYEKIILSGIVGSVGQLSVSRLTIER